MCAAVNQVALLHSCILLKDQEDGLNMLTKLESVTDSLMPPVVTDFGLGFKDTFKTAANGAAQWLNCVYGTHLPEMEIVPDHKQSTAAMAGSIAGNAVIFMALSLGTRGIGSKGVGGTALRAGLTGAFMEGVLKPTAADDPHVCITRLENCLIGFATFASMGGTAEALSRTALFALPATRSLASTITYGGLSGIAGGLVHAQAEAWVKDRKFFANPSNYLSDTAHYGAFGVSCGGLGYAVPRIALLIKRMEGR